jgi:hypothetical protein
LSHRRRTWSVSGSERLTSSTLLRPASSAVNSMSFPGRRWSEDKEVRDAILAAEDKLAEGDSESAAGQSAIAFELARFAFRSGQPFDHSLVPGDGHTCVAWTALSASLRPWCAARSGPRIVLRRCRLVPKPVIMCGSVVAFPEHISHLDQVNGNCQHPRQVAHLGDTGDL